MKTGPIVRSFVKAKWQTFKEQGILALGPGIFGVWKIRLRGFHHFLGVSQLLCTEAKLEPRISESKDRPLPGERLGVKLTLG